MGKPTKQIAAEEGTAAAAVEAAGKPLLRRRRHYCSAQQLSRLAAGLWILSPAVGLVNGFTCLGWPNLVSMHMSEIHRNTFRNLSLPPSPAVLLPGHDDAVRGLLPRRPPPVRRLPRRPRGEAPSAPAVRLALPPLVQGRSGRVVHDAEGGHGEGWGGGVSGLDRGDR